MPHSVPRRLRRSLLAVLTGAALTAGALATAAPAAAHPGSGGGPRDRAPLVVQTAEGAVQGSRPGDYRLFQGIPFAAPPVGDLRFRPPAPVQPWQGVRSATAPGSPCPQVASATNPTSSVDEDCLYLNVTTPSGLDTRRTDLPVMVWIHGGSWRTGSGDRYDAGKLALEGDVVVVTINYRLGPFGFLAEDDLSADLGAVGSGSAGLLDQQAALRWVERNVAAFGGDPRNVTIFGESAGGSSVCAQLASPTARGLFDKAIAQSYSCTADYATLDEAEVVGERVAAQVGCTARGAAQVACLQDADVATLLARWPAVGGSFVVGGSSLPVQPADAIASGAAAGVPVVHGNLSDENTLFTPITPLRSTGATPSPTLTVEQYEAEIAARYGDRADEVLALYPADAYPSPLRALAEINSDAGSALSTCSHVDAYETLAERRRADRVYAYQFRDETAPKLLDFPYPGYPEDAEHASELPYLFPDLFGAPLTAEQQELATTMVRYWTNFAATGNPNGRGVPAWHRYSDPSDVQGLDVASDGGVGPVDVAADADCAFWATSAAA
ncbi:carboxylesterase type B [Geodermatophilus normandii]|uniref:Carboxylic ester hydrolase n=1 Tax=Geodermatophilus normandii TaxID=1137989 RepID=A0A317QKI2_9ACTN|nr:carboxylesterase family protein [Geodermatophilus normandii]PWW23882.1 carboxylesterase type B [Geodermatophilus normandii]